MVNLRSGLGGAPPTQTPEPQSPRIRSLVESSLSSLSAEVSQRSDGEDGIPAQPGLTNQLSEGSNRDSKTYRKETPGSSVSQLLHLNPRNHEGSTDLGMPGDQRIGMSTTGEEQFSQKQAPHLLSHRGVSMIAETIQRETPGEALRNMREKLSRIEEERELAILAKKLLDMEAEKAAGFPMRMSEVKTTSETVI